MATKAKTAITPTRDENYPEWYQQVVKKSDLAESSPVRGCMVIKPWGYALWENYQRVLDGMFKATGHRNAYFPLLIPKSFFEKFAGLHHQRRSPFSSSQRRWAPSPARYTVQAGPLSKLKTVSGSC
jgi:prolyl-tRNA synthetase